jgi:alkanesulfonate monooxygenase SsuD/methylene tetrahydromethanopterin reductase-like flavin-dependent oxidoreductase (luciferase family)
VPRPDAETDPARRGRHPVRIGAAFWVQRAGWPALREAVLAAEAAGAHDLWIDDHLLNDEGDRNDPKLEGWTTLAAVAAVTSRARLGLLVAANTLRNPGLTAKLATTLDQISGGRAILGLGGGWFEDEHRAFGIAEFGSGFGERLDRLGEAVPLIRRLLDGERVSATGRFYRLVDAVAAPRPIQARLPLLIGGSGPVKTLPLVARHADLWSAYGSPESLARSDALLRDRCVEVGRDPDEIERTVNLNVVVRPSATEARRVWETYAEEHHPREGEGRLLVGGPVDAVADAIADYVRVGISHPILIFRTPWDLETIASLGSIREAVAARVETVRR